MRGLLSKEDKELLKQYEEELDLESPPQHLGRWWLLQYMETSR